MPSAFTRHIKCQRARWYRMRGTNLHQRNAKPAEVQQEPNRPTNYVARKSSASALQTSRRVAALLHVTALCREIHA